MTAVIEYYSPSLILDDWIFDEQTASSRSATNTSSVSETLTSSVCCPPMYKTTNILPFELNSANPKSEVGDQRLRSNDRSSRFAIGLNNFSSSVGAAFARMIARLIRSVLRCSRILSISVSLNADFIERAYSREVTYRLRMTGSSATCNRSKRNVPRIFISPQDNAQHSAGMGTDVF